MNAKNMRNRIIVHGAIEEAFYVARDEVSIEKYGARTTRITDPSIRTVEEAKNVGEQLLKKYSMEAVNRQAVSA